MCSRVQHCNGALRGCPVLDSAGSCLHAESDPLHGIKPPSLRFVTVDDRGTVDFLVGVVRA
ncbi:hypothetical protein M2284_003332 [Rhodococcus sp. LBL1]|nr:hypothetical protein [Rhodococcus sp. LBL1]MDH6685144.1 hypothetical protein [Rhodococcus sp. LBL2]